MRRAALLVGLWGCQIGTSGETLTVFPTTTLFSGIDPVGGGATYQVTIAASGAKHVTWQSSDPTTATVTGTEMLGTATTLKAGSATITASSSASSIDVPLLIVPYDAADLAAGKAAFDMYACAKSGCHDGHAFDITPSGIGKHTDPQNLTSVQTGYNPEGGEVSIGAANHSFAILSGTPEATGIVAYMRSLPPGIPIRDP